MRRQRALGGIAHPRPDPEPPVIREMGPGPEQRWPDSLRSALVYRPDAHPVWHTYVVSLIHLRSPDAWREKPENTHELVIGALDPGTVPDPSDPLTVRALVPMNLVHQFSGIDDAAAGRIFDRFIQALAERRLTPDTDGKVTNQLWLFRVYWEVQGAVNNPLNLHMRPPERLVH